MMSVSVVVFFEIVDVDDDEGNDFLITHRMVDFPGKNFIKIPTVVEPGQVIGDGAQFGLF